MPYDASVQERLTAPRKATWFELFFDLAFVLAVASLISAHVETYSLSGASTFALKFLIVWQLWLAHTMWASRFDEDRIDQHLLGFVKLLTIVAVAYGVGEVTSAENWFITGVGGFKFLVGAAYFRDGLIAKRHDASTPLALQYLSLSGFWLTSLFVPDDWQQLYWLLLVLLEAIASLFHTQRSNALAPHPEHLPERFGLFTIILLGETVAAALHSLTHAEQLTASGVFIAFTGAALGFLFWVGYYHHAKSAAGRDPHRNWSPHTVRLWMLAHLPLYLGIAGASAGTIALAGGHHLASETQWLHAVAVAVAMAGLTAVGLASPQNRFSILRAGVHLLLAGFAAAVTFAAIRLGPTSLTGGLVILATTQLGVAQWPSRKLSGQKETPTR